MGGEKEEVRKYLLCRGKGDELWRIGMNEPAVSNILEKSFLSRTSTKVWNGKDLGSLKIEKGCGSWGQNIQSHDNRCKVTTGEF